MTKLKKLMIYFLKKRSNSNLLKNLLLKIHSFLFGDISYINIYIFIYRLIYRLKTLKFSKLYQILASA